MPAQLVQGSAHSGAGEDRRAWDRLYPKDNCQRLLVAQLPGRAGLRPCASAPTPRGGPQPAVYEVRAYGPAEAKAFTRDPPLIGNTLIGNNSETRGCCVLKLSQTIITRKEGMNMKKRKLLAADLACALSLSCSPAAAAQTLGPQRLPSPPAQRVPAL